MVTKRPKHREGKSNPRHLHKPSCSKQLRGLTELSSFDTGGVTSIIWTHSTPSSQPQQSQDEQGMALFKELS